MKFFIKIIAPVYTYYHVHFWEMQNNLTKEFLLTPAKHKLL